MELMKIISLDRNPNNTKNLEARKVKNDVVVTDIRGKIWLEFAYVVCEHHLYLQAKTISSLSSDSHPLTILARKLQQRATTS